MSERELRSMSREELLVLVRDLLLVNEGQQRRIEHLEQEMAELRGQPGPPPTPREPPAFVKSNRKTKDEKGPRKKRPHGFARRREEPTRIVEHHPSKCSSCGRKLSGGWLHSRRQVLEIPVVPAEVIEHRLMGRWCGLCQRREVAKADLSALVLSRSRVGLRLASEIVFLDSVCRLPLRSIQRVLWGLHRLHLSEGEIVRVQHAVAQKGQSTYEGLLAEVRCSKVVHADETGARESGQNGYVWSLSTPKIRYYHRERSRGSAVIQKLLGHNVPRKRTLGAIREAAQQAAQQASQDKQARFSGKLVSDFYSAYSWYKGAHQRCLVHLDRDLDELVARHHDDPAVAEWVEQVLSVIERAKAYAREQRQQLTHDQPLNSHERGLRVRKRQAFQKEMAELARPYCNSALPQRVLAKRIRQHLEQLFVFVEDLEVPSDNNPAERAVRPFVVLRKISGGTRSSKGSDTQAVLLTLFETWTLRGQDLLQACQEMLTDGPARAPC